MLVLEERVVYLYGLFPLLKQQDKEVQNIVEEAKQLAEG